MFKGQRLLPVQAMEAYVRSRGLAPLILNLGAGWRGIFNFTHLLLCSRQLTPVSIE